VKLICFSSRSAWDANFLERFIGSPEGRFPRLFSNVESVPPGMTWPTMIFTGKMTLWLGKLEVQLLQLGRGHTKGDTVVWLPQDRVLLSGDLVEFDATPYAGDAYFKDWPQTLDNVAALKPLALVPGRGPALKGEAQVAEGLRSTAGFIADVRASVEAGVAAGKDLNAVYKDTFAALKPKYGHWVIFDHCMPFDVTRCFDEMTQYADPRVWTAERDRQMWETLEG
jgi:glyoxylase-like metal-dependent hydrolase (beta-lactamase superfamily II)